MSWLRGTPVSARPLSFFTQLSIDVVRDEELLRLLRDANFAAVFIGVETPRKASLAETRKTQNEKLDLVEAIHTIQSHNLFIWAGMIVGFDHDDAEIFDEQFEFLQNAQIPVAMLSVLLAIPGTPLYTRLKAEGRLLPEMTAGATLPLDLEHDEHLHWEGTDGRTNFRPLRLSVEELQQGQKSLYQRLYSPTAFQSRLIGNLQRFGNVRFRPERFRRELLSSFLHLASHNWRQGPRARRFFWGSQWTTLRHSPRSLGPINMQLGMYEHFAQVHAEAWSWNPWEPLNPVTPPQRTKLEPCPSRLA